MTILNRSFDVITHDVHPNAQAALMKVFAVEGYVGPYSSLPASGTPVPGSLDAGTIVVMNSNGNVAKADNDDASSDAPALLWTVVDGDKDLDGAFVGKVTCLQGGMELKLDSVNYVAAAYTPGDYLTCGDAGTSSQGMWRAAAAGEQIYGVVSDEGLDATNELLYVLVPAGICPAAT